MNNKRKKTSKIWLLSKEDFQQLLDSSSTMVQVLEKLGLNPYNGNHRTLKTRIKEEKISTEMFLENRKIFLKSRNFEKRKNIDDILKENSSYNRGHLKKRLIKDGKLEYKCSMCGNYGIWLGKQLVLQLEHKNGINNDNRIENLCLLCPNCHSQTKTYSGKNSSRVQNGVQNKIIYYCECGNKKSKMSKKCFECHKRNNIKNRKIKNLTKAELEDMIRKMPITQIAKKLKISDTGLRKYARKVGIDIKSISKYCHKI